MPVASPFLDRLLDTWGAQARQIRHTTDARLDDLRYAKQDLLDARTHHQQKRGAHWRDVDVSWPARETRWTERLRRLEEWQAQLGPLNQEWLRTDRVRKTWQWFKRAEQVALAFNRHLHRRAEQLERRRILLHDSLADWQGRLEKHGQTLKAFEEKQRRHPHPLLVSRARKRPEEVFVKMESLVEQQLETYFEELRRAATHTLSRLYKAYTILEKRAQELPALFEIPKRQLEQDLKNTLVSLFALRERILNDLLLLQSNRRTLRGLREGVRKMKCIEDLYRAPLSSWQIFLRRLTA